MRKLWLLFVLLALVSGSAFASHDWTVHPEQLKSKFVSTMKGLVLGVTVVTNFSTIPPTGIYHPGIDLFLDLINRGAQIVCYNQWEGPEVGMDAEVPFDLKKNMWLYREEDDPIVSLSPLKRKFSYLFAQKEFSELDYCLLYNDVIYPLNINCYTSKLSYKSTLTEDFAEGYDIIKDEINLGLYSIHTNRYFIAEPVTLQSANGIAYKGGFTTTNRCKVAVKFNAKSWALNFKISDPVGEWVMPGSYRELGVKKLYLDGMEIKDGMKGDGFLFTNDVLVLNNYHGKKLEFKGGLDIMCPYGSTNIFEKSKGAALIGRYGFCNFLGYGRVVFRTQDYKDAVQCKLCALLLNEVDSFNAEEMTEVVVDNEYYLSAPLELYIDGKSAMYNREGPGWRYDKGCLYLDNFQGTNIYCDGFLKVYLEPNSKNTVHGLLDSGYGDIRFFGNKNATLTLGGVDHSFGNLSFSNITVNVTQENGDADFYLLSGSLYSLRSQINIFPSGENRAAMLNVVNGSVSLTNSALYITANDDTAVVVDGDLQLKDSYLNSSSTLEVGGSVRFFDSDAAVGRGGDCSFRAYGDVLAEDSHLDLDSLLDVYGGIDLTDTTLNLSPNQFGEAFSVEGGTTIRKGATTVTGSAYFMTNVFISGGSFTVSNQDTNAFICDCAVELTNTTLKVASRSQSLVCETFTADNSSVSIIQDSTNDAGITAEKVNLKGRRGRLEGSVKCETFLMLAGSFEAECDVPLEAAESIEFKGGNAELTGYSEAVSCPNPVTFSDGLQENLNGFLYIQVLNGKLIRKE